MNNYKAESISVISYITGHITVSQIYDIIVTTINYYK